MTNHALSNISKVGGFDLYAKNKFLDLIAAGGIVFDQHLLFYHMVSRELMVSTKAFLNNATYYTNNNNYHWN